MVRILGLSGSLRKGSFNSALLRAAAGLMPESATLEIGTIEGVPLYHGDLEAERGLPEAVIALKDRIAQADALLLVTPEYNNSIPGVFKNAIDWLSRPPADIDRVFRDKPVALIGASAGGFGTVSAQAAWLPVLRMLRVRPWFGGVFRLSRAGSAFNDAGRLADQAQQDQLRAFVAGFAAFCASAESA